IASHDEVMGDAAYVRPGRAHRRAVLRPQLERIACLDAAPLLKPTAAALTVVSCPRLRDITRDLRYVVASVTHAAQMVVHPIRPPPTAAPAASSESSATSRTGASSRIPIGPT